MEEVHRTILRKNRTYIVNNLSNADLHKLVDYMLGLNLLTENMRQDILEAENTAIKRTRVMLDILPKRGPTSFKIFCDALIHSNLRYMAEQLNPSLVGSAEKQPPTNTGKLEPSTPIQASANNNSSTRKSVTPVPLSIPLPSFSGAAGSQPTPDIQEPKLGRQVSREVEKTYPPSDEQEDIENNWPGNLNMAPFGSSDFTLKPCTQADLKTQLTQLTDGKAYHLASLTRGHALIIKNIHYADVNVSERFNSDNDSTRIQMALEALKFKVFTRVNVTSKVLCKELKKVNEYGPSDAFILVILSYGGIGTVRCIDGKEMDIQDIVNMFSNDSCPSLAGKPKMFFIQACGVLLKAGNKELLRSESVQSLNYVISGLESVNLNSPIDEDFTDTTPGLNPQADTSDILMAVATSPDTDCEGEAAKKNYNSEFILGLAYMLCNYSKNMHLLQLLKTINTLKKDPTSQQPVQLCEVHQSLKKKVYFIPGYVSNQFNDTDASATFGSSRPVQWNASERDTPENTDV